MAKLNNCLHCGHDAEFVYSQGRTSVQVRCSNCLIQTQLITQSTDYSALLKVAEIWNLKVDAKHPEWSPLKSKSGEYNKGSKVAHKGKKWISNADTNLDEPGVSGWTEEK